VSAPPGIGYEGSSGRQTAGLGNAWGTRGGSFLRGIFNAVIPVTVVERWYGELDGSLFGLTAGFGGFLAHRPSIEFFSESRDWELHSINVWYPIMSNNGGTGGSVQYRITTSLFTAFAGYNPIEFNPTILFGPQLITNETFNQGTVRGQGGSNPVGNPLGFGYLLADESMRIGMKGGGGAFHQPRNDAMYREYIDSGGADRPIGYDRKMVNTITFRRPLRIRRGRRITVQLEGRDDTFSYTPNMSLECSITYTELPNPRGSYST